MTEAEAAFRIQKSDLSLRPVWHHKEDRVLAHILVCFLAYVLWKFLGQLCRKAGLGDEPRRVLAELAGLRVVDVVLSTRDGQEIRQRCVTQPTDHQKILLQQLGLGLPAQLPSIQMECQISRPAHCAASTYVKRWGSWANPLKTLILEFHCV